MLCKGRLSVISDTHENRKWIAEHSFSTNGNVGLPGCFCTVLTEEGCLTFVCFRGQSHLIRPSVHFVYFWLFGRHVHVLIAGTTGYQQIISISTHKGILLEFGQEIVYVDCVKEGEWTETWGRPSLKVIERPMEPFTRTLAVRFMNQEDSHTVKRRGAPIFNIFIRRPVCQT